MGAKRPPRGQVAPGNIDLTKRPIVHNPDGSYSTVRSASFNIDGREVLVPTVSADGKRILSDQEALDQYRRTGQHLGMFDTPENATAYAQQLHDEQAKLYGGNNVAGKKKSIWGAIIEALNPLGGSKPKHSNVDYGFASNDIVNSGGFGRPNMLGVPSGLGGATAPAPSLDGPMAAENLDAERRMIHNSARTPGAFENTINSLGLAPMGADTSGAMIPSAATQVIPSAGPAQAAPAVPDPIQQYLDMAMAALGPAPDMSGYVRPYDEATQRAKDAYAASTPVINQLADELKTKLAGSRAEAAQQGADSLAAMRAANAQVLGNTQAMNGQVLADIAAQGGQIQQGAPTSAAQAMAQALQSNLASQGSNYERSAQALTQARDASVADRLNGVEGMRANSLSNAQVNLDSILNQLGIGRANAERQYQGDLSNYQQQVANTKLNEAKLRLDQAKQNHDNELQLDKNYAQAKASASQTAGETWQQTDMPQLVTQFPKTYAVFQEILSNTGSSKGPVAQALAMNALNDLKSRDQRALAQQIGFTPDQGTYDMLSQWIQSYFDATPSMNMEKLAQELAKRNLDPRLVDQYGN